MVNEAKTRPQLVFEDNGRHPHLPELHNVVRSLDQVVSVDYYIPGCPPTPKITKAAVAALLDGRLPPKGAVLAPDIALCEECPRRDSKPTDMAFTEFKRTHQKLLDPAALFPGPGRRVHGPGHAPGLRRAMPRRQHALHGLLRRHRPREGPGREDSLQPVRQHRREGGGRNRQGARRHPRSGGHVLPLRPGAEPPAAEGGSVGAKSPRSKSPSSKEAKPSAPPSSSRYN